MSEDMSNVMNQINQMLKNNEIPDEIKNMMNQFSSNSNSTSDMSSSHASKSKASETQAFETQASEKSTNEKRQEQGSERQEAENGFPNFDMSTMLKMKSIIDSMNQQKDDPRANLLMSLKPYLKSSRKQKVDQYVKLFQMGKVFEVLNPLGGEKNHDV